MKSKKKSCLVCEPYYEDKKTYKLYFENKWTKDLVVDFIGIVLGIIIILAGINFQDNFMMILGTLLFVLGILLTLFELRFVEVAN